jgi:hypothetical protein
MEENFNQNQTQFSADEPILEQPLSPIVEEVPTQEKKKPSKYIYLIIGAVVFILTILILAVLNRPDNQIQEEDEIVPTPTMAAELTPIEKKLNVAIEKLEDANPTTEKYPFPPIDAELRIDDGRR